MCVRNDNTCPKTIGYYTKRTVHNFCPFLNRLQPVFEMSKSDWWMEVGSVGLNSQVTRIRKQGSPKGFLRLENYPKKKD